MGPTLRDLPVLVVDCQASGASPAHGDLLEIAWAACDGGGLRTPVRATWLVPASERGVTRAVRKLTGWDESCLAGAALPEQVWRELCADAARLSGAERAPTAIHYARFELGFLSALHGGDRALPLDVTCVHAISRRLHPDLPRRSLRALAGHLGFPAGTARRAADHVEATAFVWRAFVADLAARGVTTWSELAAWVEEPAPKKPAKRTFPLAAAQRRALPSGPGVYRFVRRSGDVLYVGKATDLKKRVASHFTAASRGTSERALEMLTQVDSVRVTRTETALEAALLECDEIKRLDPPYNVHLKTGTRRAWYASRDLERVTDVMDDAHPIGPLPSAHAIAPLPALRALVKGAAPATELRARALGVPEAFAPDEETFAAGFAALLPALSPQPDSRMGWLRVARALGPAEEHEDDGEEGASFEWTPDHVREQLARALSGAAAVVERARRIRLLEGATVTFVEPGQSPPRTLVLAPRSASGLDLAGYDRLRVLVTELARVAAAGSRVEVRVGGHVIRSGGRTSSADPH